MKIKDIWFDGDYICGRDEAGREYRQSLLWYPKLRAADDNERAKYTFGFDGIHWRALDEDVSFESFEYEDSEPTALQRFFLTRRDVNVSDFAKSIGITPVALNSYINGFSKPTAECNDFILSHINERFAAKVGA